MALGFEPARIRNNDYWYHSPLCNEEHLPFFIFNNKKPQTIAAASILKF
jgi:hypothetical protein